MSLFNNTKIYFCKYVDTATSGVVAVDWATIANRVKLTCTKCGLELTCEKPQGDDDPIDYGVQAFVNLHAHNPPKQEAAPPNSPLANWGKQQIQFHPLPVGGSTGQTATFDMGTDKSQMKQAVIADKLKQYQDEVNAKTDDLIALKIAQLQAEGAEKAAQVQKNWLNAEKKAQDLAKLEAVALENKAKAAALKFKFEQQLQDQINENKLKKAAMQAEMDKYEAESEKPKGKWVFVDDTRVFVDDTPKPKKAAPALEEPEGRKFR